MCRCSGLFGSDPGDHCLRTELLEASPLGRHRCLHAVGRLDGDHLEAPGHTATAAALGLAFGVFWALLSFLGAFVGRTVALAKEDEV
jgi:hypothetical protein